MSIKRITNPTEFCDLIDDMDALFKLENASSGHKLLTHNAESLKANFSHPSILAWDLFVWGNKNAGSFDACIMFVNDKNPKFATKIFSEFLWLSKNPKAGYKLFKTAIDFARKNDFEFIVMNTVTSHPSHEKVKSFYNRMGFLKDCETYISKL